MEGPTPADAQVVGSARPLGEDDVRRLRTGLGPLSVAWCDGAVRFWGTGEAAVHAGPSASAVLAAASGARVDVSGQALAPPAPWFCGFAFDGAALTDGWWESFPAARAFVPKLLLAEGPAGASLTAYEAVRGEDQAGAWARAEAAVQLALIRRPSGPSRPPTPPPAFSVREDVAAWQTLMEHALQALASGMLRKVVLARAVDVSGEAPFVVEEALARAQAAAGAAVVFAVRAPDGTSFLGASPECLVRVEGRRFWTQALAGSAGPGEGDALAGSPKEVREHTAVVEDVRVALDAVAEQLEVAAVTQVSLGYVTHLDTRMAGTLRPGVTPAEAVLALHPTAAVSGAPRDRARAFLRAQERLARGWYAGAVGWVGAEAADLRVALRCALVRGCAARLFVGAGVVEGSTPAGEWAETGRKALPMLHALLGDAPWPR